VNFLIVLVVFAGVAYRVMTPRDRTRYQEIATARLADLRAIATAPRPDYDAFVAALRARAPRALVAPALVLLNVAAFFILSSATNLGTRTTNGEWWRLLTSAFLHGGVFQLAVESVVLIYAGVIVERLVGRAALASTYLSAAAIGGLQHIASHPVEAGTSASAALCGVFGLAIACVAWQVVWHRRPEPGEPGGDEMPAGFATIPRTAMKRIGVLGVVFVTAAVFDSTVTLAALASGFATGLCCGVVLGYNANEHAAGLRAVASVAVAGTIAAVVTAMPLRNIADVAPELARVVDTEARTADTYKQAFERFTKQRLTADALADVADKSIVPELRAVDARLASLRHVPPEHAPLVADAREFLRLRTDSWTARADALRRTHSSLRAAAAAGDHDTSWRVQAERRYRSSIAAAGKAEAAERMAADAFARVRTRTSGENPEP
jgi:membrane associated rhomboid family serine protease